MRVTSRGDFPPRVRTFSLFFGIGANFDVFTKVNSSMGAGGDSKISGCDGTGVFSGTDCTDGFLNFAARLGIEPESVVFGSSILDSDLTSGIGCGCGDGGGSGFGSLWEGGG